MAARLKDLVPVLMIVTTVLPGTLQAQANQRFRVLVPDFQPRQGAGDGFGRDAAKELRTLLNSLATHQPIERDQIEDDLDRFDMRMRELDCIRTRQLAAQVNAQLALCASYTGSRDGWTVDAEFWDVVGGESFEVGSVVVQGNDAGRRAARHIFDSFDRYVDHARRAVFCQEYAQSQQWESALENCDRALELNPEAVSTRFQRARIFYETDRYGEALEELDQVLEANEVHEDALQLAGYISALQDEDERARGYYSRYLQLDPSNAQIRMRIAYDLAQAGDPLGAMQLIQGGLEVDPANANLLEQYGGFAFSAAVAVAREAGGQGVPAEAAELYRMAIGAYEQVFEIKGERTPVGHLRNILAAYIQLDEPEKAAAMGPRVLETHAREDALWSIYADALQRSGRLEEGIAALERVREINPSHPTAPMRLGSWLVQTGSISRATDVLAEVAAQGPQQAEQAVRLLFNDAYQKGVQRDRYPYAIDGILAAKRLPNLTPLWRSQLDFWHGYSIYTSAMAEQQPQTLETAEATLPKFQRALELFRGGEAYAASQPSITLSQFLGNARTYIEIQEAIIKRGR